MQGTAQAYLAFEMTRSPAFLGYVAFAQGVPTWIFMIYAGAIVDRVSRRKILILTQLAMMILAFVMTLLSATKTLQPWHILMISALMGVVNSFDAPARQSFASELVDRKDLTNALALNGALFNMGSTVGPAIAGFTYVMSGPTLCFALNGFSFLAVLMALFRVKTSSPVQADSNESIASQLKDGVSYAANHRVIGVIIFLAAAMSLFGVSVVTIFPAWAVHQLNGDARVAGYLQAGRGLGAVVGALGVAYFSAGIARGKWVAVGATVLPLTLIGFSLCHVLESSLVFVALLGISQIMILNLSNSLIHSEVDDRFRGRVSSIFGLTFFGLMPIGGLMIGLLAERFSEPVAVIVSAVLFAISSAIVLSLRAQIRALH